MLTGAKRAGLGAACAALLIGPTVLAFFSGGYFDEARAWAGLAAWVLVAVALVIDPRGLPRGRGPWLALGGLALFAAWTLLSITWAPVKGYAYHAGQLALLYLGALLAAALLLRGERMQRAVEPALATGALIVIGYGMSERLLPGLLHFSRSVSALGRLEQPLTYWNAMGELAALGLVLCARVAGDWTRRSGLRAAAAGGTALLGMGLYVSLSRGALFACAAGAVTLMVAAPRREQLRSLLLAVVTVGAASAAAAPFGGVMTLAGSRVTREHQGAIALALLVLITIVSGLAQWWLARREDDGPLRLPRRAPSIAAVLICVGLALAIVVGAKESSGSTTQNASRLVTLHSSRYNYWRVALRAFAAEPVRGVGAGNWQVWWLRYRTINEFAQDAHSLPLQTMAELGLVGLALLAAFLAGIGLSARDAFRSAPVLAAGPVAGFVTYVAHAPLDWDWQMPAVTLVAIVLAGALLAMVDHEPREPVPPEIDVQRLPEAELAGQRGQ